MEKQDNNKINNVMIRDRRNMLQNNYVKNIKLNVYYPHMLN